MWCLATWSASFGVCSQWPQLLRRGFHACYATSYAPWYAVTPCASERSAFSASFRRVATGHAWPSEIREGRFAGGYARCPCLGLLKQVKKKKKKFRLFRKNFVIVVVKTLISDCSSTEKLFGFSLRTEPHRLCVCPLLISADILSKCMMLAHS